MAESYYSALLATMDRLWFHQALFSYEPTSTFFYKSVISTSHPSTILQSSDASHNSEEDDALSVDSSTGSISQDACKIEAENGKRHEEMKERQRPSRLDLHITNKNRSQSSSPSIYKPRKRLSYRSDRGQKLQRTLSCRTLHDLEVEELQGFMDLGFQFGKDQLTPWTMSVIPGLQMLGLTSGFEGKKGKKEDEEEKKGASRPYLSEAWLVKKPDSPLLRLRMARVSRAEDMKECLRLWAWTVASSIQQSKHKDVC